MTTPKPYPNITVPAVTRDPQPEVYLILWFRNTKLYTDQIQAADAILDAVSYNRSGRKVQSIDYRIMRYTLFDERRAGDLTALAEKIIDDFVPAPPYTSSAAEMKTWRKRAKQQLIKGLDIRPTR